MTTTNPYAVTEEMLGLPSAAELTAMANALFPDLTTTGANAPEADSAAATAAAVPASQNENEAANIAVPETTVPQYGSAAEYTGAPEVAVPQYGSTVSEVPQYNDLSAAGSAYQPVQTPASTGDAFDWAHPFTYGASEPAQVSYAPKVQSKQQAEESDRRIDVATSLNGADVAQSEKKSEGTGRNDSIRIGSRTLAEIRNDFPILSERINGNPLVWLDNGATTQRPKAVIDRLTYYYEHENSNVHRGAHTLAARSTDAYEAARDTVRDFIGASGSEEIIFVRGTTEAINLVANAYVKPTLAPGDEIIVSILEHHANIVPWQLIAEKTGAVLKVIPCDETGQLIMSEYEKLFTKRTKFVAVTHVSNVLGTVTPVEELVATAHRHGVRILIDGAQSVAHIPVNVSALDADFFVFSGHKIFAPTGIGVVYGKRELLEAAEPYHGGGNMIADVTFERTIYNGIPNKFEAGTGSIADAVGLGAALQYLTEIGMPCIYRWEHELLQYAMHEMKRIPGLTLIGTALNKASVLSFKLDGYSDEEVGKRLDSYGIAVRTGHHCAQPVLRHFGYEGSVRPTLALYNSPDDIDALVKVLRTFA